MRRPRVRPVWILLLILTLIHGGGWLLVLCSRLSLSSNATQTVFQKRIGFDFAQGLIFFELISLFVCGPILFLGLTSLAAVSLVRFLGSRKGRAARRAKQGLCPRCGYDLRASKERCPECGTLVNHR